MTASNMFRHFEPASPEAPIHFSRGKGTLDPMSMVLTMMPLCGMCLSCVFLGQFCRRNFAGKLEGAEVLDNKINTGLYPSLRMQPTVYTILYYFLGNEDP